MEDQRGWQESRREERRYRADLASRAATDRLLRKQDEQRAKTNKILAEFRRAVAQEQNELARDLLSRVGDINVGDYYGYKPLHIVAAFGSREIAEYLISRGADVDAKDYFGATPFGYADRSSSKAVADLLISKGASTNSEIKGGSDLREAVRLGNTILAGLLIASGADVQMKDRHGSNLLHYLIEKGRTGDTPMAELLIAKGVDVNARNEIDHTPLSMATILGDTALSDLFRQHGAVQPLTAQ